MSKTHASPAIDVWPARLTLNMTATLATFGVETNRSGAVTQPLTLAPSPAPDAPVRHGSQRDGHAVLQAGAGLASPSPRPATRPASTLAAARGPGTPPRSPSPVSLLHLRL